MVEAPRYVTPMSCEHFPANPGAGPAVMLRGSFVTMAPSGGKEKLQNKFPVLTG